MGNEKILSHSSHLIMGITRTAKPPHCRLTDEQARKQLEIHPLSDSSSRCFRVAWDSFKSIRRNNCPSQARSRMRMRPANSTAPAPALYSVRRARYPPKHPPAIPPGKRAALRPPHTPILDVEARLQIERLFALRADDRCAHPFLVPTV